MADGGAERKVKYITSFKKQIIGPSEALCIETYRCPSQPVQAWVVDVQAQTPEVWSFPSWHVCKSRERASMPQSFVSTQNKGTRQEA